MMKSIEKLAWNVTEDEYRADPCYQLFYIIKI